MLSVTISRGVILQSELHDPTEQAEPSLSTRSHHKLVEPNDIVYNKMRAWQGAIGNSEYRGIISPDYVVERPRAGVNPRYFHYLFRTREFAAETQRWSYGIASDRWRLRHQHFKAIRICLPPSEEQTAIVRYLDHADELINRYISAKERLITLLEEQRQAVIHHAVTRGLDFSVALKPSGIPWAGNIPDHWRTSQVKRHYATQLGKMIQPERQSPSDTVVPYLKAQHVHWFHVDTSNPPTMWASDRDRETYAIARGDLLICEGGEGGRAAIIKNSPDGYIIQNALHRVRPIATSTNEFLLYLMRAVASTGWFDAINSKATIAHFTAEKLDSLFIPIPPHSEQVKISSQLSELNQQIDEAASVAADQIRLMNEYRNRLIADVVTGQIDVRDAAVELPD